MTTRMLRSPRQTSYTYSLGGSSPPRQKDTFFMSIKQAGSASNTWSNLSYLVKSTDRPNVQPKVEELNQYNKKRQVNVGYSISPIRIAFYDTADSSAVKMWNEYAKQYFGDFSQDASSYYYDMTSSQMFDSGNGFGFSPVAMSSSDTNAQFWLDTISIFQVYGGQFVQYDLINPKISSFDLDQLDYSDRSVPIINMTVVCEAVKYVNDGYPQPISANSTLAGAFATFNLDGDVYNIGDATYTNANLTTYTVPPTTPSTSATNTITSIPNTSSTILTDSSNVGTGLLTAYGTYDFGNLSGALSNYKITDLSLLAATNPVLASALNIATNALGQAGSPLLSYTSPASLSSDEYNAIVAKLTSAGVDTTSTDYVNILASAIVAAVETNNSLVSNGFTTTPAAGTGAGTDLISTGMQIDSSVYQILNSQRSPTSQLGSTI